MVREGDASKVPLHDAALRAEMLISLPCAVPKLAERSMLAVTL